MPRWMPLSQRPKHVSYDCVREFLEEHPPTQPCSDLTSLLTALRISPRSLTASFSSDEFLKSYQKEWSRSPSQDFTTFAISWSASWSMSDSSTTTLRWNAWSLLIASRDGPPSSEFSCAGSSTTPAAAASRSKRII